MRTRLLRGKLTLLFMTFALVLAVPAVALATDVITADGDTITAGNQASRNLGNVAPGATVTPNVDFWLSCGNGGGQNRHFTSEDSATIAYNAAGSSAPAGGSVSATNVGPRNGSSNPWGVADNENCPSPAPAPIKFGTSVATIVAPTAPGNYTYTVRYNLTSNPGSSGTPLDTNMVNVPLTFTLTVEQTDNTPPTSSDQLSSAANANGWHNQNVTVTLDATDNQDGSGVKELTYSASGAQNIPSTTVAAANLPTQMVINQEGTTTISYSAKDNANNVEQAKSVTIKLDKTPPSIQDDGPTTQPNSNGWYNAAVTNQFSASDATSGLANSNQASFQRSSGANEEGSAVKINSGAVSDLAGNTNPGIDSAAFKIDLTKPNVSVTGVSNGATYTLGSVPTAGCNTTDALSGVDQPASVNSNGGPVGSITVNCNGARDNAGNTNSASVTYSVVYNYSGFFRPIDNLPTLNSVKAGSAVPVKFSLDGNQGLGIIASGWPKAVLSACDTSAPVDAIEETVTAGGSSLSYDATSDQYNYVWKTDKASAGKCVRLDVKFIDGTTKSANFKLLK